MADAEEGDENEPQEGTEGAHLALQACYFCNFSTSPILSYCGTCYCSLLLSHLQFVDVSWDI